MARSRFERRYYKYEANHAIVSQEIQQSPLVWYTSAHPRDIGHNYLKTGIILILFTKMDTVL